MNDGKIKCIAVDFDGTLATTLNRKEVFKVCTTYGVPEEIANECFLEIYIDGFSFSRMRQRLENRGYKVGEKFEKELLELRAEKVHLFPEIKMTTNKWEETVPVVIITGGDKTAQNEKIKMTGLEDLPCIITKVGDKTEAVQTLVKKYGAPIAFIDDKITEMESLVKGGISKEDVIMLLLDRTQKYGNVEFEKISSLDDPKLQKLLEI